MKILLIATWGFPGSWKKAKYIPPIPPEETHKWTKLTEWQWSNEEIPTYSTTVALTQKLTEQYSSKEDIDIQILIYGVDTLACPPKLNPSNIREDEEERKELIRKLNEEKIRKFYEKDPEDYNEVRRRAEEVLRLFVDKYFEKLINEKLIKEESISIRILPGVGLYKLKYESDKEKYYEFIGSPQNTALVLELDLFDKLNEIKPSAIILDISHGINYLPVIAVDAVLRATKVYSALTNKSIPIAILNSDPVIEILQKAKIHLVQVLKVKETPLSLLREIIINVEKNIPDINNILIYKMIKQTKPPEKIINLDKEIKQLYKEYFSKAKGILTESEYGLVLYTLTFHNTSNLEKTSNKINSIVETIHKALSKRKSIPNEKSIKIEYEYALQSNEITSIIYLLKLLKEILKSKNEGHNTLISIDYLEKYAEKIGLVGPGEILLKNEIHDIKERVKRIKEKLSLYIDTPIPYTAIYDLAELLNNYPILKNTILKVIMHDRIRQIIAKFKSQEFDIKCKDIDERNFLAHAGLERNSIDIMSIGKRIYIRYRDSCREQVNKIIENLLKKRNN